MTSHHKGTPVARRRSLPESDATQADEGAFLTEVRAFLEARLTPELRAAGRATVGTHTDIEACRQWHRCLYEQGWIAPNWPEAYGGTGWTARQRLLFDRECARNDAPILFAGGLRNVGPLLIAAGTPRQRAEYLPRILSGEDLWCQGYSEPGAGSDLAALRTGCRRRGDHYRVTGRKIWTTGADLANRMFALVRTASGERPQQGITFLLIDMHAPGISVRPVMTISGEAEFNEVVFDDVPVPVADRVGAENEGWAVAKTLMYYARASNTTCGLLRRSLRRARNVQQRAGDAVPAEAIHALNEAELRLEGLERIEYELAGFAPGAEMEFRASVMKVLATELHQKISTLALELAGPAAMERIDPETFHAMSPESHAGAKYFATRAASIYSGTNEIHRNILARHLAGPA